MVVPRTAVVTGSSRGIGKAIALELLGRGYRVVLNSDSDRDHESLEKDLTRFSASATYVRANVSSPEGVDSLFAQARDRFGPVHVLVNNAGITRDRTLMKMSWEQWNEVLQVDLSSVFLCCRRAIPDMVEAKWGRIVNIASIVGQLGAFGQSNYAAAKAGIIAMTRSLAMEVARHDITVNAICPGYIATAMVAQIPADVLSGITERIPLKRLGAPEDIARTAAFLVEDGSYITGTTINVNGGLL